MSGQVAPAAFERLDRESERERALKARGRDTPSEFARHVVQVPIFSCFSSLASPLHFFLIVTSYARQSGVRSDESARSSKTGRAQNCIGANRRARDLAEAKKLSADRLTPIAQGRS